jgi:hypothetical protein
VGKSMTRFRYWKIKNQIWRVNTHDRRCWAVSCAWSHRRQASGCCSPRLARQSAVQILPFKANQMKNLQRRGAQLRQILRHAGNFMEPTKKAS